jgi:hypothetical protein
MQKQIAQNIWNLLIIFLIVFKTFPCNRELWLGQM